MNNFNHQDVKRENRLKFFSSHLSIIIFINRHFVVQCLKDLHSKQPKNEH